MNLVTILGPLEFGELAEKVGNVIATDRIFSTSDHELRGQESETGEIGLEDLANLKLFPWRKATNLSLDWTVEQAESELLQFSQNGGFLLCETTPIRVKRRPDRMFRLAQILSEKVNFVVGTGWSPYDTNSHEKKNLENLFVEDIRHGFEFHDPEIASHVNSSESPVGRAGIIGEIYLGKDFLDNDTTLSSFAFASVITAHLKTLCPVLINIEEGGPKHAYHMAAKAVRAFRNSCSQSERKLAIAGLDSTLPTFATEKEKLNAFEEIAKLIKENTFLLVISISQDEVYKLVGLSKSIELLKYLLQQKLQDSILLGQKTKYKTHLRRYGGFGYSFNSMVVMPALDMAGIDSKALNAHFTRNLMSFLVFWDPPRKPDPEPEKFWNCDFCNKKKPESYEPFTYLDYKYCSMKCLKQHKAEIASKNKKPNKDNDGGGNKKNRNINSTKWGIAVGSN